MLAHDNRKYLKSKRSTCMSCDWIPTVQLEKDCNRYRFIQAISNQGHSDTYCSGVEEMDFGGEHILPITVFCFFLIEKFFEKI